MKKFMKILFMILVIIIIIIGIVTITNWNDINNFRPMVSGAFSKFMCSCLFVEQRSEEQCLQWSKLDLPVSSYSVNQNEKSVTASALGKTSKASYTNERFGCTLQ